MRGKNGGATLKQKMFAREYVKNGGRSTDAVMKVYKPKNKNVAKVMGIQSLRKPAVQTEIETVLRSAGLGMTEVASKLAHAIDAGLGIKATNSDTLRGIDMLLKLHNAYPERIQKKMSYSVQQHVSGNYSDVKKKLQDMTDKSVSLLSDVP